MGSSVFSGVFYEVLWGLMEPSVFNGVFYGVLWGLLWGLKGSSGFFCGVRWGPMVSYVVLGGFRGFYGVTIPTPPRRDKGERLPRPHRTYGVLWGFRGAYGVLGGPMGF